MLLRSFSYALPCFALLLVCLIFSNPLPAQPTAEKRTYMLADTAEARVLFAEAKDLLSKRKSEEALLKAEQIKDIYKQTLGINTKEYATAWHQVGWIY